MQKIARISAVDRITGEVVGHDIADGAVAGTFDRAGGDHVPEGDAVGEEKCLFLSDTCPGTGTVEDSGQGLPEAVLRVVVEKMSFPGFDGREGSEDQDPGRRGQIRAGSGV